MVKHFSDKSLVLVEGEPLELECKTWGYPLPQVKWTRLARSDASTVELITGGRVTLSDIDNVINASLTVTDMSIDDYGTYTCVAHNGIGNESDSEGVLVRVKGMTAQHSLQAVILHFIDCFLSLIFEKHWCGTEW